jgi:hypothetical protein
LSIFENVTQDGVGKDRVGNEGDFIYLLYKEKNLRNKILDEKMKIEKEVWSRKITKLYSLFLFIP